VQTVWLEVDCIHCIYCIQVQTITNTDIPCDGSINVMTYETQLSGQWAGTEC